MTRWIKERLLLHIANYTLIVIMVTAIVLIAKAADNPPKLPASVQITWVSK